ncbi:MAG TPA: DNA repair exonuclease [Candidatus Thermoplasmatota archaeon]|nr:DNA repair exonuclease [Candidatus Thermoplasmatota archaeon]
MNILHLADTHLGYSAYRKTTEEGVNQREVDIYDAFHQVVDYAIHTKSDLVIHAGDLFDSVRPTNRAITVAVQELLRLSNAGIPVVMISGNHETPKLKETGNIFSIFEHIDHVTPVHRNQYEKLEYKLNGESLTLHAIPQCQTPKEFDVNLQKITVDKKSDFNVLLVHGAVLGIKEFKMNEFNELFIPVNRLKDEFDYIALGHYHTYTKLQKNAVYAGSTEHLSFTEAPDQKGCVTVTLGSSLKQKFIPVKVRPMLDLPPLDCSGLTADQVSRTIKELVSTLDPAGKIIRLRLEDIASAVQHGVDFHRINDLCRTAVHFEVKTTTAKTPEALVRDSVQLQSLADEYKKFLDLQKPPERDVLYRLGLEYINKIIEQDDHL